MKQRMILYIGVFLIFAYNALNLDEELDYSIEGQKSWESEYCQTGNRQSPIDINPNDMKKAGLLTYNYGQKIKFKGSEFVVLVKANPNYVKLIYEEGENEEIKVTFSKNDVVTYELNNIHFHCPSEHSINGSNYDCEGHIVFQVKNTSKPIYGKFLVFGIFFKKGFEDVSWISKLKLTDHMDTLVYKEKNKGYSLNIDSPKDLIESAEGTVFIYNGSLTTPNCAETVLWYVFEFPLEIKEQTIKMLSYQSIRPEKQNITNNRKTQNLNQRSIHISYLMDQHNLFEDSFHEFSLHFSYIILLLLTLFF